MSISHFRYRENQLPQQATAYQCLLRDGTFEDACLIVSGPYRLDVHCINSEASQALALAFNTYAKRND